MVICQFSLWFGFCQSSKNKCISFYIKLVLNLYFKLFLRCPFKWISFCASKTKTKTQFAQVRRKSYNNIGLPIKKYGEVTLGTISRMWKLHRKQWIGPLLWLPLNSILFSVGWLNIHSGNLEWQMLKYSICILKSSNAVIKTLWYWQRNRQISGTESRKNHINTVTLSLTRQQRQYSGAEQIILSRNGYGTTSTGKTNESRHRSNTLHKN